MLNAIRLHNEQAAHLSLERLVWPSGPVCPHCGETSRLGRLNGLSTPVGAWKCYACRKPFTIRNGSIFHNSHVPLHVWLQALYLLTGSGLRMGSQRLAQILGVSVRTAWQLKQKIMAGLEATAREASRLPAWAGDIAVIRCASLACQSLSGPGSAICEARYERFLAAIESGANAETDIRFAEALRRLLTLRHETADVDDEAPIGVQLELGLLAGGESRQQAAAKMRTSQAQLQMKG